MSASSVHDNIAILSGSGGALALIATSVYFMSSEYNDFDRVSISHRDKMRKQQIKRRRTSKLMAIAGAVMYIAGLILLVLSIGLFHDEREAPAKDIAAMIHKQRRQDNQPSVNEPAILAGLATVVVLAGAIQSLRNFRKDETFGWLGTTLYAGGWLANGFAASMQNNSISSVSGRRLAWTLPGAAGIVIGTACLPWQIRHQYVSGPGLPVAAIGYVLYTIGNSAVLST